MTHVSFSSACALLLLLIAIPVASAAGVPEEGDAMPSLTMIRPDLDADRSALGLSESTESFELTQIFEGGAELVLLEVIGVYCPFCHQQAPLFNDLSQRLQRSGLDSKVVMMAVASGATEQEISYLREHSGYAYPLLRDQDYSLHAVLGEPQTPFTLIVNSAGTILFTHLGVITDIDDLFTRIKEELD